MSRVLSGARVSTDDFDALAVAGAVSRRVLVGRLGGTAGLAIGLGLLLTAAISSAPATERWGMAAAGLFALGSGAVLSVAPWRVPLWTMDIMAVSAAVTLVLVGSTSAGMQPALPVIYVIIGNNLFATRSWLVAISPHVVAHAQLRHRSRHRSAGR